MWGVRPTCTPFLRNLSPRLSSYYFSNKGTLGYLENLNQIANWCLGEFYDKLALITQGPLWTLGR